MKRSTGTAIAIASLAFASPAIAQQSAEEIEEEAEGPHHLSLVVAGTHVPDADETAFSLGIDYEYRVSEALGLGLVAEHAFGPLDSTTLLAVADIHLWKGWALQIGPGVEFAEDEEFFLGRLGTLYEFEIGDSFTLAPQVHYDLSEGEDAIVFGVGVGRAF